MNATKKSKNWICIISISGITIGLELVSDIPVGEKIATDKLKKRLMSSIKIVQTKEDFENDATH